MRSIVPKYKIVVTNKGIRVKGGKAEIMTGFLNLVRELKEEGFSVNMLKDSFELGLLSREEAIKKMISGIKEGLDEMFGKIREEEIEDE